MVVVWALTPFLPFKMTLIKEVSKGFFLSRFLDCLDSRVTLIANRDCEIYLNLNLIIAADVYVRIYVDVLLLKLTFYWF